MLRIEPEKIANPNLSESRFGVWISASVGSRLSVQEALQCYVGRSDFSSLLSSQLCWLHRRRRSAAGIAKILFYLFLILFLITLVGTCCAGPS